MWQQIGQPANQGWAEWRNHQLANTFHNALSNYCLIKLSSCSCLLPIVIPIALSNYPAAHTYCRAGREQRALGNQWGPQPSNQNVDKYICQMLTNTIAKYILPNIIAKEVQPSWSDSCRASGPASSPAAPTRQCGPACYIIFGVWVFFSEKSESKWYRLRKVNVWHMVQPITLCFAFMQVVCLSPIVVKVQEDKSASHLQVVDPLDEVVLKTETKNVDALGENVESSWKVWEYEN